MPALRQVLPVDLANPSAPTLPHDVATLLLYLNTRLFDLDLSLQDAKQACRVAHNQISSRFRYYVGMSPQDYVIHHRMEAACVLLRQNRLSVSSIALEIGYERPNSFAMTFKRSLGMTPTEYRAQALRNYDETPRNQR